MSKKKPDPRPDDIDKERHAEEQVYKDENWGKEPDKQKS
jgi:hypothetical protein